MNRLAHIVQAFGSKARTMPTEYVSLDQCFGRILAEEMVNPFPWPPFNRSLRDGFALNHQDTEGARGDNPVVLRVKNVIPAGLVPDRKNEPSFAAKILTGAKLPEGADAVIPFEEVQELPEEIVVTVPVSQGQYIRHQGTARMAGERLVAFGTKLGPEEIGLLASAGVAQVKVFIRPVVSVIAVGSELVEPGFPLPDGKIYSSNSYTLAAWINLWGGNPRRFPSIPDELSVITGKVLENLNESDIIVTTGGASRGDFDLAPEVLSALDGQNVIRVLPKTEGGPFVGGVVAGKPILSFSGSPKAAQRSARIFLKPLLAAMLGTPNVPD